MGAGGEDRKMPPGWDPSPSPAQAEAELFLVPRQGPSGGLEALWQRGPGPEGQQVELLWAPLPLPPGLPEVLLDLHEGVPGHSQGQQQIRIRGLQDLQQQEGPLGSRKARFPT